MTCQGGYRAGCGARKKRTALAVGYYRDGIAGSIRVRSDSDRHTMECGGTLDPTSPRRDGATVFGQQCAAMFARRLFDLQRLAARGVLFRQAFAAAPGRLRRSTFRASALSGSETISGTSADASQYLTREGGMDGM